MMPVSYTLPADKSVARATAGALPFGKHPIELSITVADNLVFLYPNAESAGDAEAQATFIVSILLFIPAEAPAPSPIESLTVELRGMESLGFPNGPFEQNIIRYLTKRVEDACATTLVPGNAYRWEVPVEVNHCATPYERMKFGRVFQKMRVKLEWADQSWFSKYKSLEVERDVWMTCIPRASNMLDYARTHRSFVEHLGPVVIHARTQHLTVGGYLRMGMSLPAPSPTCKIIRLELAIIQSTTLHSRKRPGVVEKCAPERVTFLSVEKEELQQDEQGAHGIWLARIPSCDRIRPSTLEGSKDAAIRLSHQVQVRIIFNPQGNEKDKPLVYTAQWPVVMPSCSCRWRSLKLPSYSKYDPCPVPDGVGEDGFVNFNGPAYRGRLRSHLDQTDCTCGIPIKEILKNEDEFDDAQHVCSSRLVTEELQSAATVTSSSAAATWVGNNGGVAGDQDDATNNVGVGQLERESSLDEREARLLKARQLYNNEGQ